MSDTGYEFSVDLGSLIDAGASYASAYYNYKAQKEATDWSKEQYYHNLDYNRPINQMARLAEAGINPHMAYAKGTINNVASPAPTLSAPQIDIPRLGDRLEQLLNLKRANADIQNLEEQNKNMRTQNTKLEAEARKAKAEARVAEHDASIIENSPFSSRANQLQSLAQFFGQYGGKIGEYFNPDGLIEKYGPDVVRFVLSDWLQQHQNRASGYPRVVSNTSR